MKKTYSAPVAESYKIVTKGMLAESIAKVTSYDDKGNGVTDVNNQALSNTFSGSLWEEDE